MSKNAPAGKGHNKPPKIVDGVASEQLLAIVQRIETLEEEKSATAADISDVYSEAKGHGFDRKAIRQIVKERAMDAAVRAEHETLMDTYRRAIGLLPELDELV